MTFAQLLLELEGIKKSDPELLKSDLIVHTSEGDNFVELAVTLPGRQLKLLYVLEAVDAG